MSSTSLCTPWMPESCGNSIKLWDEIGIIIIRIYSGIFTEMKIRIINLNIRIFERLLICHFLPKIGFHTSNVSAKL